jgi:hypothetical protein
VRGESQEEVERIAREDQLEAQRGLVPLMREVGEVYHLGFDQLTSESRPDRIRYEKALVAWLKERLEQRSYTSENMTSSTRLVIKM